MQNKGFVKVIAVLLSLICLMYLSFSYPTHKYEQQAEQMTAQGKDGAAYLDSMGTTRPYGSAKHSRTAKPCRLASASTSRAV